MAYFPFFVDLAGKAGLIVGGGTVALRKVEKLLPYSPQLTVVAPEIAPEIRACGVRCVERTFAESDLDNCFFVIAATDNPDTNHRISALCAERNLPVNVVDDKAYCSFLFPALVKKGDISIGISTGGASPTAAIHLKQQIADLIPDRMDEILEQLAALRSAVRARIPVETDRAAAMKELYRAALEQGAALSDAEGEAVLQRYGGR